MEQKVDNIGILNMVALTILAIFTGTGALKYGWGALCVTAASSIYLIYCWIVINKKVPDFKERSQLIKRMFNQSLFCIIFLIICLLTLLQL